MSMNWDVRFLRLARNEVAGWSKDPDEKVGCVIVSPSRRQWTAGYNGFPQNIRDGADRFEDRELKNLLTVHAELNAILNARTDLSGWTLYTTKPPCTECAKAIIQAGIVRVVSPRLVSSSRWHANQKRAKALLAEASVVHHVHLQMKDL